MIRNDPGYNGLADSELATKKLDPQEGRSLNLCNRILIQTHRRDSRPCGNSFEGTVRDSKPAAG